MSRELLASLIAQTQPVYAQNPYWIFEDEQIKTVTGEPFSPEMLTSVIAVVQKYFATVFRSVQTEAQVLVVKEADAAFFRNDCIPELATDNADLAIFVLPQNNTWGTTSVSEVYWQKMVEAGITPYVRIHSHHTLAAYQSQTDWSTLNSGSLEMVLGDVFAETPQIAYWLDVRGTDAKDNVWNVTDGETHQIKSGRPIQIDMGVN